MNRSRRDFLKHSVFASTGTLMVPNFLKAFSALESFESPKRIVIVQLSGGNDGLNTVVPFRNDLYYNLRPKIGLPKSKILGLNDEMGLNPGLLGLKRLYDDGMLSIINNVGYPNPERSHFRAMDIWQTASDSDEYLTTGWVGRFLDATCEGVPAVPHYAMEIDYVLDMALKGQDTKGIAALVPHKLFLTLRDGYIGKIIEDYKKNGKKDASNVSYLYKTMVETYSSAEYLYRLSKIYKSNFPYPATSFGRQLRTISELINSGSVTKVYYVPLQGFDTHNGQQPRQEKLLKTLGDGLKVFVDDLKKNGTLDDTLVMTFSEFGRRVKENASAGTDHGTANNIFVVGGKLRKPGFYNAGPDLANLENGDLKFSVDFREVYATMLNKWLGMDEEVVLGKSFTNLSFI